MPEGERGADYVLDAGGTIAACGGLLWHYNRPYGDLYMHVAEPFRRRGMGAYLVQEIKRACYERGSVPGARCNPTNTASRSTLQKAGFVPCGHILTRNRWVGPARGRVRQKRCVAPVTPSAFPRSSRPAFCRSPRR